MKKLVNSIDAILNESLDGFALANGDIVKLGAERKFVQRANFKRVNDRTRSMGVALTSCTVPAAGKPTFDIGADEMEMGVGIHGEPGRRRVKLKPAREIVEEMVTAIAGDLGTDAKGDAILLVNGFGATPLMELYLLYNDARSFLEKRGIT